MSSTNRVLCENQMGLLEVFLIQRGNSLGLGLPCYTEDMKYVIE